MPTINRNAPLQLSDGTPVALVKVTSKGNLQVRVPTTHPIGRADPLRIFTTAGRHSKRVLNVTLQNVPVAPDVFDYRRPMFLSDGTPVTFVKVTPKGNVQVRLPSWTVLGAQDPLRIFNPKTGRHYKNAISVTLGNAAPTVAARTATSTPAAVGTVTIGGTTYDVVPRRR